MSRWVYLAVGVVVAGWAMLAVPARATYNARTTADEPQYLLSALSLAEDHDLWIDDELARYRYEPFHEVLLPVQTEPRDDGHAVSPHDPLLPTVLAVPMGLGGWAAAKATLALLGGALAALLTWTAHRRFDVSLRVAAGTVLAFGLTAPLTAYATQIYPEIPAALAVTVVIAALTGPLPERVTRPAVAGPTGQRSFFERFWLLSNHFGSKNRAGGPGPDGDAPDPPASREPLVAADPSPSGAWLVAAWVAIVSLPWLGVKYAPVAAVLALLCLARLWRAGRVRAALAMAAALAGAGVVYLVGHRLIYGGWTVYAAGDHFVSGGELSVVGHEPNYAGRSQRLVGLLLDRSFGLAAWMPGYLLAVPALAALLRRRPTERTLVLVAPLAAGWATATWVALTMHGWWWPGRQTVVVLPCVVLAVAWWIGQPGRATTTDTALLVTPTPRPARAGVLAVTAAVGVVSWLWLVGEVWGGDRTLIVDFDTTTNPLYRGWRLLLPDYRHPDAGDWLRHALWLVGLGVVGVCAWRRSVLSRPPGGPPTAPAAATEPSKSSVPETRRRPTHVPA